ncbi:MAG TPA: DnaJ domain-containing protein [Gaiellaceae bacterium]
MSNYYEILGVWRDASEDDIDLAAQALDDHWRGQLALNDPSATDWLQIIHQARKTLIDPKTREAYDQQLDAAAEEEKEEEEEPVLSPGFPWRPYTCALLAVPVLLAVFVLVLALIANHGNLTNLDAFKDSLLTTLLVTSAVALPLALVVLLIAASGRRKQHNLRLAQLDNESDPVIRADLDALGRLSEYTDVAVWVTWGAVMIVIAAWIWLIVLLVGSA